jgi:hypothetical protein
MFWATKGFGFDQLLSQELVPKIMGRASGTILVVLYGFGDASGKGLGSGIARSKQPIKHSVQIGVWGYSESIKEKAQTGESSQVCLNVWKKKVRNSIRNNCIAFFFTDSSTVEYALYSGTSSFKKLMGLVLRFKFLQTNTQLLSMCLTLLAHE